MLLVKWQITTWRRLCEVVVNDALLGISETQFCKTVVGRRSAKPDLCRATFAQQRCSRRHVERKAGVAAFRSTKRACGQVGNLKLLCPNVRRCKLLIFNYLQMFSWFPSAETKRGRPCDTIKLLMFNNLRPPHLPQTHVGCWLFVCRFRCQVVLFHRQFD